MLNPQNHQKEHMLSLDIDPCRVERCEEEYTQAVVLVSWISLAQITMDHMEWSDWSMQHVYVMGSCSLAGTGG